MTPYITGKTAVLGIIGWPVTHSLSPPMQNAALQAMGLDYVYVPFGVAPDGLSDAVLGLRKMGVAGFNVTIPHKTAIVPLLDRLSPEAEVSGAVNTVKREGELLVGYNTDGIGLVASLRKDLDFEPGGARVVILGAGGAASGAIAALSEAGVASVTVVNRSLSRADALIDRMRRLLPVEISLVSFEADDLVCRLSEADLLINTTSVGMNNTCFDNLDLGILAPRASVYDMVYVPSMTPLLAAGSQRGLKCANGLGMLAAQGEAAFTIWTGKVPPPGLMKDRLLAVISGSN